MDPRFHPGSSAVAIQSATGKSWRFNPVCGSSFAVVIISATGKSWRSNPFCGSSFAVVLLSATDWKILAIQSIL